MSLRFDALAVAVLGSLLTASSSMPSPKAESGGTVARSDLSVCADPNNLPFSNQARQGFENRIAELLARDLGRSLRYYWMPQRRGFIRNTLNARHCDLIVGVPASLDMVLVTEPYYRSTYVFVTRRDRGLRIRSLDDPVLRRLRIGVHFTGDDYDNPPAAQALTKRGLGNNVVGYSIYGDYSRPDPPADLIRAVSNREVDVAIAWGPLAGYFARRSAVPLTITPVSPSIDLPFLPFVFDIAAGVRRGDTAFRGDIQRALDRHKAEISQVLVDYGVPRIDGVAP